MTSKITDTGVEYLDGAQVRIRYGNRSDMWLLRRQANADFPKPMKVGPRNFWRLSDLISWEKRRQADA